MAVRVTALPGHGLVPGASSTHLTSLPIRVTFQRPGPSPAPWPEPCALLALDVLASFSMMAQN